MAIESEPTETTETEPGAAADGGLTRLDLPGQEPITEEDLPDDERESS
jgi:hypothetical protein